MAKYLANRLLQTIVVVIGITLVTFILMNVVPGDPILLMLGQRADPATVVRVRHEWGLDKPLMVQYGNFLLNALKLDLGRSYFTKEEVMVTLVRRFAVTAKVGGISYIVSLAVGLVIGVFGAVYRGKWQDRIPMIFIIFAMSAPAFWVGLILQIIFGLYLGWLPITGLGSAAAYILPCTTLGLRYAASTARYTRTAMLEVIGQDYVRTARAKGLKEKVVIGIHGLKNALIPIITLAGMQLGSLMAGAMLTETVFSIPGIGKLTVDSMLQRDLPMLQGCVMYIAIVFVIANLIVDILYAVIDPRIRVASKAVA